MARHTGLEGTVSVDGNVVAYIVSWTMGYRGDILRHRGASERIAAKYLPQEQGERVGTFEAESDPSDTAQASLMSGMAVHTLVLTELSGETHTFDAITTPGVSVPRSGRATRSFSFEETA